MQKILSEEELANPVYIEKKRIEKRKEDGIEAYQNTQAGLRLTRLANGIPDSVFTEFVYQPMDAVINKISSGNWLDAYNLIGLIIPNAYLTSAMLLSFKNQIANYIVGDGDYMEYIGKTVNPLTGVIS
jgi:hypothetical protein